MQVSLLHFVCVYSILSFWAWILVGLAMSYILWFKCDMSFRIILCYLICVWKMIVISTNMVAHNRHFCHLHNNWQVQVKWCYGFLNSAIWQSCFFGKKSHKGHTNSLENSFPHRTFTKFCPISKTDNSPLKNGGSKGKYKYLHTWVMYLGSRTSSTELFNIWGMCSVFIRNLCLWPKWQSSTRRYRKSYHHH